MTAEQQQSLLTIALLAAFADGAKAETERSEIRRIASTIATESGAANLAAVYQNVLLKRASVATATAGLDDPAMRQLAYELAVCVCDADGEQSSAETRFLADLQRTLGLDARQTAVFDAQAAAASAVVLTSDAPSPPSPPPTASSAVSARKDAGNMLAPITLPATLDISRQATPAGDPRAATAVAPVDAAALDKSILNYAILNGALELLPQSWASMAIIPLQIKMVYGIGKAHGVALDQGHIREFIAAAGVGLTSQYLEQFGRKLLGRLLGSIGGKTGRGVGRAGARMAMSFATTYALGQLARRYYAGGRVMNTALLRETFQGLLEPARQMQTRYLPQIQQKAGSLDAAQVMAMVRGG